MAYTTIDKPTDYFETVTYTGNGVDDRNITGLDFQPDMLWSKRRDSADNHSIYDIVRGDGKELRPQQNSAELDRTNNIQSLNSDGFQVGDDSQVNASGGTYVSWGWSGGGTASSNTDGDITSSVSHNSTSGFSIGTYTGTGTAGDTVGHGLNANPDVLIVKERGNVNSWVFSHKKLTNQSNYVMLLNTTDAQFSDTWFNSTSPTSSVFSTNGSPTNRSGGTYVFYAFTEKKGYSKFGSYTGNGSSDGSFIFTGFKPAFVMFKNTETTANWGMIDNKRDDDNVVKARLFPNLSDSESSSFDICDFTAQGFKLRTTDSQFNSAHKIIYMAFAENPFVTSTGICCTAR